MDFDRIARAKRAKPLEPELMSAITTYQDRRERECREKAARKKEETKEAKRAREREAARRARASKAQRKLRDLVEYIAPRFVPFLTLMAELNAHGKGRSMDPSFYVAYEDLSEGVYAGRQKRDAYRYYFRTQYPRPGEVSIRDHMYVGYDFENGQFEYSRGDGYSYIPNDRIPFRATKKSEFAERVIGDLVRHKWLAVSDRPLPAIVSFDRS